jgi:voltage-gated potassium channel Kch
MDAPSLGDRLRYRFDSFMSRGTIALIAGLGAISMAIIVVAAAVITLSGVRQEGTGRIGFGEAGWESLVRTLDAGTMGGDTGWGFRLVMLGVTIGGVFVISALIGVLTTGLEHKLEELRKGRSRVIEANHTVILGWSQQVFSIVSELVEANANQKDPCIVILGDKDRIEMEDAIRDSVGPTGRTRIVCRTGSPISLGDLDIVSPHTARSIIVLSPEGDEPDTSAIKTILAITNNPGRKAEPYHIVAEITHPGNVEAARMVGRDEIELVLTGGLISRIIAQTCRQSGLSVVYTELLDFGGDEIYFKEEPALTGRTFGEALLAYEDSAVIGLRTAAGPRVNPPMDTRIQAGDQIIAVSEDDDTVRLSSPGAAAISRAAIQLRDAQPARPERTLILGWNWRAPSIIQELDRYVAPGSAVTVVAEVAGMDDRAAASGSDLHNQAVAFQVGDTTDRRTLDGLKVETYKHVIVLAYDHLEAQRADARTLITLLHLRDIADRHDHPFSIVSEMLDLRNRALAEVTKADDFIVSDKLVSLMLAQISENKELNAVFTDIFDPEGSEIYLKLASNYVKTGEPVNFYTVVEAARQKGEVALGYRLAAHANDAGRAYGVAVNPDKSRPISFAEWDRIIVLAED